MYYTYIYIHIYTYAIYTHTYVHVMQMNEAGCTYQGVTLHMCIRKCIECAKMLYCIMAQIRFSRVARKNASCRACI